VCLFVYECALLERWVYIFCVTFPALAFSCIFTILSGGLYLKAIETKVNLPFLNFEILRLILIFRFEQPQYFIYSIK